MSLIFEAKIRILRFTTIEYLLRFIGIWSLLNISTVDLFKNNVWISYIYWRRSQHHIINSVGGSVQELGVGIVNLYLRMRSRGKSVDFCLLVIVTDKACFSNLTFGVIVKKLLRRHRSHFLVNKVDSTLGCYS